MSVDAETVSRPKKPRPVWWSWPVAAVLIGFTWFTAVRVGFSFKVVWEMPTNPLWGDFFPPDYSFLDDKVWDALIETFQIAILATVVGCALALPLSFAMSRLTSPNKGTYFASKSVMNVVRTVPDLFWAKLFVTAIGIGAFAGTIGLTIFSLSVMVKLFSETIDAADAGALEAAKAAGSKHVPAVRNGVLPEVLPNYVAYALYIFELNIRASIVLGLVGAGGIGRIIERERQFFHYENIMAIITVLFVIVIVLEQVSVALRRRLV